MLSRAGALLLLGSVPSATAPGSTRRRRRRQVRAAAGSNATVADEYGCPVARAPVATPPPAATTRAAQQPWDRRSAPGGTAADRYAARPPRSVRRVAHPWRRQR